jgi:hypothetical protein
MSDEMTTTQPTQPRPRAHRRRAVLIAVALLTALGAAAASWAYNSGLPKRHEQDTAILRAAPDPSTYITAGDYSRMTVPIRNDGPDPVTVVGLYLPTAPQILWDGSWTVIQPGATANLRVEAPYSCPATPHALTHTGSVPVLLRVFTVNGNSHASLRTSVSGVLQYAADYCASQKKA